MDTENENKADKFATCLMVGMIIFVAFGLAAVSFIAVAASAAGK